MDLQDVVAALAAGYCALQSRLMMMMMIGVLGRVDGEVTSRP